MQRLILCTDGERHEATKRPSKEPKRKEYDGFLLGSHREAQYCMEFHWLNADWKAVCSLGMVERTRVYTESEQEWASLTPPFNSFLIVLVFAEKLQHFRHCPWQCNDQNGSHMTSKTQPGRQTDMEMSTVCPG